MESSESSEPPVKQQVSSSKEDPQHTLWKIAVICMSVVVFIIMIVFSGLAGTGGNGVFDQSSEDVANKFSLEITPSGGTFSLMWGLIHTWNALWLLYGVSTIFRGDSNGKYIYQLNIVPPVVYFLFIINNLFNITWLSTWNRDQLQDALPLIAMTTFTLYIALLMSHLFLNRHIAYLRNTNMKWEILLVRCLVQNGMAFYAAWVTIVTLLNFSMVISYVGDVSVPTSSTVSLSLLLVELLLWFILDIFVLDNYTRYTVTPFLTAVIALSSIIDRNYNLDTARRNSEFSLVLLIGAVLFFVMKIGVMLWRHFKKGSIVPNDVEAKECGQEAA